MIVCCYVFFFFFFFSSRRRHTRSLRDWSSDVCSSDLEIVQEVLKFICAGDVPGRHRWKPLQAIGGDRKSTRLNSSHVEISYAVFCLKKKKKKKKQYK